MINAMSVCCVNREKSCIWRGTLEALRDHLNKDCKFVEVECPNEDCNQKIQRKKLSHHQDNCPKKKIQCPECDESILKQNAMTHKEECPKALITCPHECGE